MGGIGKFTNIVMQVHHENGNEIIAPTLTMSDRVFPEGKIHVVCIVQTKKRSLYDVLFFHTYSGT